jgi:hypothetical protein
MVEQQRDAPSAARVGFGSRGSRSSSTPGLAPAESTAISLQHATTRAALSSEALVLLDSALRVVMTSPDLPRLLGIGAGGLRGRPLSTCADVADAAAVDAALGSLRGHRGARGRWDLRLKGPTGPPRTFECRAVNLLDDPTVAAIVVVLRDVHEQRMAEAVLRDTTAQLNLQLAHLSAERAVDAALSRIADLLQHCTTAGETHDVVWSTLPALLPGLRATLYFESDDGLEFMRHRGDDDARMFLASDSCWALRTRRAHVSRRGGALRCDHVDGDRDTACLPLVQGGHAFGLVVVAQLDGGPPLPDGTVLDALAGRLGVTLSNARGRRSPEDA